ncbi:MAG: polysaccharide deacetylase family protein [Actinobacteria bacterium]|nr:polysaccharide deacetylase family protein [Actinomycetota bacterium]
MRRSLALLAATGALATGCGGGAEPAAPVASEAAAVASPTPTATRAPSPALAPTASPTPDRSSQPTEGTGPDLTDERAAQLGVNELGRVLVVQWHKIQDVDGRWENSIATFRAQLRVLYERGYRPVSASEFIEGTFPIPAGTTPVLLTFDDSYKEHLYFGPDGSTPDPDSVVGILQAMEAEDPTWRARAVFSFYWPYPFRETDRDLIERKLRYLVANGFDLANHTYTHDDLSELSDADVVANLARAEAELAAVVGDDYHVRVMTLTQGIWPQNPDLALRGEHDGFAYEHDIALEVGFMPTRSPHHVEYDRRSVQRVQAFVEEFDKWVAWLDEEPGRRFVSDGDATVVTYPSDWSDVAAPRDGFLVRTYG